MLLLLDNAEHLLEAAHELSQLLQHAEGLTLLVTSRELLRIQGETSYALPPLAEDEGIALYCERAQTEPSPEITELCTRLEGLPLAIELAAARTAILTPAQLLDRLSSRLDLLKGTRDADPRQRTLRATIEWSYDLLNPDEQRLFRALSVFQGGCTLEAAEEVAGAELDWLQSLVDKSLLRFTEGRFWMLETIREYAGERLEVSRHDGELRARHAEFFVSAAEQLELRGADQIRALGLVDADLANYRAAQAWLVAGHGEASDLLRLFTALSDYWWLRGRPNEGRALGQAALAVSTEPTLLRAEALRTASELALVSGKPDRALTLESVELSRKLDAAALLARCLNNLGALEMEDGNSSAAAEALLESAGIRRANGDQAGLNRTLGNLAYLERTRGNLARARELYEECLLLQADPFDRALDHAGLGVLALEMDDLDAAARSFGRALESAVELDADVLIVPLLISFARVAVRSGDHERACRLLAAASRLEEGIEPIDDTELDGQRAEVGRGVREALDGGRLAALSAEGRLLTRAEAVDYALASLD